jgi:hypothetical protein
MPKLDIIFAFQLLANGRNQSDDACHDPFGLRCLIIADALSLRTIIKSYLWHTTKQIQSLQRGAARNRSSSNAEHQYDQQHGGNRDKQQR